MFLLCCKMTSSSSSITAFTGSSAWLFLRRVGSLAGLMISESFPLWCPGACQRCSVAARQRTAWKWPAGSPCLLAGVQPRLLVPVSCGAFTGEAEGLAHPHGWLTGVQLQLEITWEGGGMRLHTGGGSSKPADSRYVPWHFRFRFPECCRNAPPTSQDQSNEGQLFSHYCPPPSCNMRCEPIHPWRPLPPQHILRGTLMQDNDCTTCSFTQSISVLTPYNTVLCIFSCVHM